MSLKINHNLEAMEALRNLTHAQTGFAQSMQRLSSGKRINSAADDAAGYAISNKLMAQSTGLNQAQANAQDGISMVQTASGGLQTIQNLLQRFRQLAVQSANDTNTSSDRSALQDESNQISQEITQIATTTQFNTKNLLDGSLGSQGQLTGANTVGTATATYNGSLYANGNSPTINTGTLAAKDSTGATVNYTFTLNTVGAAAALGANGTMTGAVTDLIGSATKGVASYSGAGQTQTGVVGGTYNLTVTGAKGSSTISISAGTSATTDTFQNVLDKINAVSNQTGVAATFTATKGITLTNSVAGSAAAVTATGQDQLLRGLGLSGADAANYTTAAALSVAEQQISSASASGTDGTATLTGGSLPVAGVTLQATGNRFADSGSGFSYDLNAVKGLFATGAATFTVNNSGNATLQVGANANQNLTVNVASMTAASLGVGNGNTAIDITSQSSANAAITTIDSAIQTVSHQASTLGAVQNRLTAAIGNLAIGSENMTAAYSAITDVNMAQESTTLATNQILQQSSTAMLAQANQASQGVLKLLG